jgi:Druantia protein DruA
VRDSTFPFCQARARVNEPFVLQGRSLGPLELSQAVQLIAGNPGWSRYRLSCELAQLWDWRSSSGQLKDMAARTLLLKLEERGLIELPVRRRASPNRMRHKQVPALDGSLSQEPIKTPLANLLPLQLVEVSTGFPADRGLFEALLHQFHYLSYRSPIGENLQYLARERTGRPVACVLFGAAAWQCADRDQHLGWDAATRAARLHLLANNTRFMVMPWIEVSCLASHVLGLVLRRIGADWQRKYGHPIYLLETFVQRDRFAGTCYQAANWIWVGQTKGRTRQDAPQGQRYQAPIKDIYLFALHPQSAQRLRELINPSIPLWS